MGCRFGLRVLVDADTELCRKSLVGVMSLRDLSTGRVQTDVPGRTRAALAGVVIVARLLYRSSMEQRMFFFPSARVGPRLQWLNDLVRRHV